MSDKQEMIADIVMELRNGRSDREFAWVLADRIEAAHRRKLATAEKSSAVGNMKAMREAAEFLYRIVHCAMVSGIVNRDDANKAMDYYHVAVAAPPRQCDMGTAEEQSRRMHAFCDSHGHGFDGQCYSCENCRFLPIYRCELAWAQLPYESEAENGSK